MWGIFQNIFGISGRQPGLDDSTIPSQNNNEAIVERQYSSPNIDISLMFTNPFEIHKYFEREMDNLIKNAFGGNAGFTPNGWFQDSDLGKIDPNHRGDLRDSVLKPGYNTQPEDSDIDLQISTSDVHQLFSDPPLQQQPKTPIKSTFYFESVRTVQHPDGKTETIRTVRDHEGREETTITQQGPEPSNDLGLPPSITPGRFPFRNEDIFAKFF